MSHGRLPPWRSKRRGRIAWVACFRLRAISPARRAWFDELRRSGFIEGKNLTVEFRAYGQHVDLIPQYAAELVKARVDVIAIAGDEAVRAVQQATTTIPIVALAGDMLGSGLALQL